MSMQSYISAHCRAAATDRTYRASDYFGGGDYDDWGDVPSRTLTSSEMVAGTIGRAARAFSGNLTLARLHASTIEESEVSPSDISPAWSRVYGALDGTERSVLRRALEIPVQELGIKTVAMVRRLPEAELLKAKGIGPGRALVLKSLGHNAARETELSLIVEEARHEEVLKPVALAELASRSS